MGAMTWLRIYLRKLDGEAPACPECGHAEVCWRLVAHPTSRLGYALLWCSACRKGAHLSRLEVPQGVTFVPMGDTAAIEGVPAIEFMNDW